ncbi:MAG TPA: hypothetical protein PLW86_17810 [Rhodocyclaceae bacterium]|nr:hypothetical protein [Rhodocyclaceae bacterium]
MKMLVLVLAASATLAACSGGNQPPEVADWFKPVVDGQAMETVDYVKKYCTGTQAHVNCTKANMAFTIAISEKDPAKQKEKFAIAFPNK